MALDDSQMHALEALPLVLTVAEAAKVFRISAATAYEQAHRWEETEGVQGLPVLRLGRVLRVPRSAVARLLETATAAHDEVAANGRGAA